MNTRVYFTHRLQYNLLIILILLTATLGFPTSATAKNAVAALGFVEPQGGIVLVGGLQTAIVTELRVNSGDTVKQGQVLAILNNYATFQANLQQAQAELLTSKAKLQQLQAGASPATIQAQEAKIARIQVELTAADSKCSRAKRLQKQQAISQVEQEDECLKFLILKEQLHEAQATLTSIAEVRNVDIAVAKAELGKAEATLFKAKTELETALVRAPIAGRVLKLHTQTGELIGTAGLLELAQTGQMWIRAEIYETDIAQIHRGQVATITSDGFSEKLHGTVQKIGLLVGKNRIFDVKPSNQTDARMVEMGIQLSEKDSAVVASLTHLQVSVIIEMNQK